MKWLSIALVALLAVPAGTSILTGSAPEESQAWIWSGAGAPPMDLLSALGLDSHEYSHLGMASFIATPSQAAHIARETGGRVTPNEIFELHLDDSIPTIEADLVVDAVGYQRNGPSVMVVDTGVDSSHPDFQSGNLPVNIAAERVGGLVKGVLQPDVVIDEAGHGTHVAGIVAGSGESLGSRDRLHGRFTGVYYNGRIVGFQALAENTEEPSVDTAAALEAFDWAIENKDRYKVRVIQNSWGLPGDLDPSHPVNEATLELYLDGINVVFSAGNRGRDADAMNRHCLPPWVLCVAAVNNDGDRMAESSVGQPGPIAPAYLRPDLAAPGVGITAAGSIVEPDLAGSVANLLASTPSNELYEIRSGTSMAAPHVSGVAALILAANPELSPDQVMDILVETSLPIPGALHEVGAGMLNARTAYNLAIQTPGNRDLFEAGQQVKYAGERTGDPTNELDAVTVGYTDIPTGGPVLAPRGEPWMDKITESFAENPDMYIMIGLGVGVLLVIILVSTITVAIVRR